jgi:hypothetical protein
LLQDPEDDLQVTVYRMGKQYQSIIGFGGAFTDATGENLLKHDVALQQTIIEYDIIMLKVKLYLCFLKLHI